ncbi:MAG: hypothetical protein H0T73_09890 [Ardenticatenales bacterium]|nr:hypothetical protein [Ardenticatenales bacterium]
MKGHAYLRRPEQRAAFFQHMRAYFGTDDKTIAHFSKLRKAAVKGATTILHDEAASRLEKVQAEIGEANMPSSGGVGWPRSECTLASQQNLGNLHNLGFAIDYNATQTPHLDEDQSTRDLIQVVTGRSATASYGSPEGLDTREVGNTFTHGTDEEKEKLKADPRLQAWLERVGQEAESLSQASEDFRSSLKSTDDKGIVTDLTPQFQALRQEWFQAKSAEEKQAILVKLQTVLKPWLDKVAAQKLSQETKIKAVGLDPATLPSGEALKTASEASKGLAQRLKTYLGKVGPDLKKGQRKEVDKFITDSRKLLGEADSPLADDAAAVAELRRLADLVSKRVGALGQKNWFDRMTALHTAMTTDGSYVFGTGHKSSLAPQISKTLGRLKDSKLSKGQRKEVNKLIDKARDLINEAGVTPPEDADAVVELRRLSALVDKHYVPDRKVSDPSLSQLVDVGFFNLKGKDKAGPEAFNVDFVKSMVKHGFNHGATWSTPDLMHFELRWDGPG